MLNVPCGVEKLLVLMFSHSTKSIPLLKLPTIILYMWHHMHTWLATSTDTHAHTHLHNHAYNTCTADRCMQFIVKKMNSERHYLVVISVAECSDRHYNYFTTITTFATDITTKY